MALGCGRLFGIKLTQNFNFPYFAKSIAEFWHCWHISLTSWFRDYLYIPLGGNRVAYSRWCVNIFMVFVLSGLWHGANWTFICWGALHGIFYLAEHTTQTIRSRFWQLVRMEGGIGQRIIQTATTFSLVTIAWVFFRAENLSDAFYIISHMFSRLDLPLRMLSFTFTSYIVAFVFILFICLELFRYIDRTEARQFFIQLPFLVRCPVYLGALLMISLLGLSTNEFIYFHF